MRLNRKRLLFLGSWFLALALVGAGLKAIHDFLAGVRYLGREGVVFQRREYDCGAAALAMIFEHFRVRSNYEDLIGWLGIGSQGTTMLSLKEIAEARGLRCEGWLLAEEDLRRIPLPAILLLRKRHFVVMDSFNPAGTVVIRDPARGRLEISLGRLRLMWKGEILLFHRPKNGLHDCARWFRER